VHLVLGFAVITPAVAADNAPAISDRIAVKWIQANQNRDAAALTSLFAKDGVMMPANAQQRRCRPDSPLSADPL
jgi:ketosteroid isomerase-like protein